MNPLEPDLQAQRPLFEAVRQYLEQQNLTFHTPGHQRGTGAPKEWSELLARWGLACDITEVLGIDDLHLPLDQCLQAQQLAAQCFGAEQTFFLVNGSTVGNHAMFMATLSPDDTVLMPRACHRSVFSALRLCGAQALVFSTRYEPDLCCCLPPTVAEFLKALEAQPGAKALFFTSPTYHGACAEVEALVETAHKRGLVVLVDEAWGSHLRFCDELPPSAVDFGADLVVQSAHKMTSALTQSAWLHCNGDRVDRRKLAGLLRDLQTSSPSSLLLVSMDCARHQLALYGEPLFKEAVRLAQWGRSQINRISGLCCYVGDRSWDSTRLIIGALERGYSGTELAHWLRYQHQIQVEMWEPHQVLVLVTLGHTQDHMQRLVDALSQLPRKAMSFSMEQLQESYRSVLSGAAESELVRVRQIYYQPNVSVDLTEAVDRTSAELLYCYPPGIPIVYPGQRITAATVEHIRTQLKLGQTVSGAMDPTVGTLQVLE